MKLVKSEKSNIITPEEFEVPRLTEEELYKMMDDRDRDFFDRFGMEPKEGESESITIRRELIFLEQACKAMAPYKDSSELTRRRWIEMKRKEMELNEKWTKAQNDNIERIWGSRKAFLEYTRDMNIKLNRERSGFHIY